jgi:hypothetical protein
MKTMQLKNDLHRILDGLSAEKLAEVYCLVIRHFDSCQARLLPRAAQKENSQI